MAGYFYYQNIQLRKQIVVPPPVFTSPVPIPVFSPVIEDEVLAIQINTCCSCPTKVFSALIGTDGWVVYEKGKNYSRLLPEECDRVDCQPCPPLEEAEQTQIDCKNPRPQVCTMECIQNPPYICGSDGASYCSTCGACGNPEVQWYSLQSTPCSDEIVGEKSCGGIAANLPENQCPEGFNCLLDGDYPDAGGACVKK
ncbi:hypothetical protein KJ654_02410 [Patescibacteria group bacterium]|nr:hypothetical protein [Patescibacteria group bacterium]MBU1966816.1 hypothetical protein [Patescibacteria group bacterium]